MPRSVCATARSRPLARPDWMTAEQTLMEISGSGWPQRACALTLEGNSADISYERDYRTAHDIYVVSGV